MKSTPAGVAARPGHCGAIPPRSGVVREVQHERFVLLNRIVVDGRDVDDRGRIVHAQADGAGRAFVIDSGQSGAVGRGKIDGVVPTGCGIAEGNEECLLKTTVLGDGIQCCNVEDRGHGAIFQGSDAQPGVKLERGQSVWAGIGGTDFARGILMGIFNETLARACWRIAGQCTSSIFSRIPNIHGGAFVEFPTIAISTPWISPRIHHPACSNCSGSGKP